MVDDVEDRGDHAERAAQADQHGDQAQVADRRISQHAFQVLLEHRRVRAQDQRHQAHPADDPEPLVGAAQHRPEAHQQEHPGLHHGGRVQVGRYRRRRRHRLRQPEVERELRALGERAEQDQQQRRRIQRMRAHHVARGEDHVEVVAAHHVPQQQHAGEQAQAAAGGDDQRHPRAVARRSSAVPVADQQEREQAGHLPEEHQLDHVAGHHDAQHRTHERQQQREEARQRIVRRHVVAGVHAHQRADAADQQHEQPAEAVHPEHQVQAQSRHPRDHLAQHVAGRDRRVQPEAKQQAEQRRGGHQPRRQVVAAAAAAQQEHHDAGHERKADDGAWQGVVRHRSLRSVERLSVSPATGADTPALQ